MRIDTCWFCSSPRYPGKGIQFVRNDSKVFNFCRPKCHKNFKRKRNPRKVKWTKAFRKTAGKEMAVVRFSNILILCACTYNSFSDQDSTFDFEKRRNRPVKYDRELMANTLKVMKRVAEIKKRREAVFYKNRMKVKKSVEKTQNKIEISQSIDLIAPAVSVNRAQVNVTLKDKSSQKESAKRAGSKMQE